MKFTMLSIAVFVLAACTLCEADLLEGVFNLPATEFEEDDTTFPLDPTAKSAVFEHEGDMTLIRIPGHESQKDERSKRNAVLLSAYRWPGGVIPYKLSSSFDVSERRVIMQAMRHWEDNTCIRFRPSTIYDRNSVALYPGSPGVCASYVGRLNYLYYEPQGISLGSGCVSFSTVAHELGHAIGFYHEHNRPDRDEYITVNTYQGSLASQLTKQNVANTLGLGYDYASIMHYDDLGGVITSKGDVPFGNAEELSPLDIEKANRLYNCGPKETWSSPSTVVPPSVSLPDATTCGQVIKTDKSGSFQFPGYPTHARNSNCTYVIQAPRGYGLSLTLPNFQIGYSSNCASRYVQIMADSSLSAHKEVIFYDSSSNSYYSRGRLCGNQVSRRVFRVRYNVLTVNYHTDSSNAQGLTVNYELTDINECRFHNCHKCTNHVGSYNCSCNEGYFSSQASKTCYDVNECAFNNGGCEGECVNSAGSYSCECPTGQYLQADGVSCGSSKPQGTQSCGGTLTAPQGSFHTPNWPTEAYPTDTTCEWTISCPGANKIVALTFDNNFKVAGQMPSCLKDTVEVFGCGSEQSYGPYCHLTAPAPISGLCNSTRVVFTAGDGRGVSRTGFSVSYQCSDGPTPPPTTPTTIPTTPTTLPTTPTTLPTTPTTLPTTPTTLPTTPTTIPTTPTTIPTTPTTIPTTPTTLPTTPTTLPTTPTTLQLTTPTTAPSVCGGLMTSSEGSFHTPNWPTAAYPTDVTCEWTILCPGNNKIIALIFDDNFKVAGQMPSCPKDTVEVFGCGNEQMYGPYCHLTAPAPLSGLCNSAKVVFTAGSSRGTTRTGFSVSYQCSDGPTTPSPPVSFSETTNPVTNPNPVTIDPLSCFLRSLPSSVEASCQTIIHPGTLFGPPTFPGNVTSSGTRTRCSYFLSGSANAQHQLRIRYLDFPSSSSCEEVSFVVYEGFSPTTPVVQRLCGGENYCEEIVIPVGRGLVRFEYAGTADTNFRGFAALYELA